MKSVRLKKQYIEEIRPELRKKLGLKNIMEVPRLSKIVLNVGVKEAVADKKALQEVEEALSKFTGQKPVRTVARKSIAGFKIREGMPIGVKVTLRGDTMYEFLDRLINLALPKVRDFRGIPSSFDRRGNYNLGIKEWAIFPELEHDVKTKVRGLNISFTTTTKENEYARELLKSFGMPFKKEQAK